MTQKLISDIIYEAAKKRTVKDKVKYLQENSSRALQDILVLTYDKRFEILLPDSPPPFEECDENEASSLHHESKKLTYFVQGFSPEGLKQTRREAMFIEMLESVHPKEAAILINMIAKTPYKGLTATTINKAFGPIIEESK